MKIMLPERSRFQEDDESPCSISEQDSMQVERGLTSRSQNDLGLTIQTRQMWAR